MPEKARQQARVRIFAEAELEGSYYGDFLAEREEILKHKWIRSEQEGQDIGLEKALTEWCEYYRETWRKKRKKEKERENR